MTHPPRALLSGSGGQLDLPTGLVAATWSPAGGCRRLYQLTPRAGGPLAAEALAWIGVLLVAAVPAAVLLYRHNRHLIRGRLGTPPAVPARTKEATVNPTAGQPHPAGPGARAPQPHELRTVRQTTCCVVGAGPAGAMLALLLARQRIPVVLLEAHGDFDRDFRGDSLHPAIMQVLDELSLAGQLLELPHRKLRQATLPASPPVTIDLSRLPGRFPYITLMPQAQFLEFLTTQAARHPAFELVMRANVRELIEQDGIVRGVRYHAPDGWHEVRAALTVGADGRFSQTRRLSGLTPVITAATSDVLWLRLPRLPGDPEGATGGIGRGHMILLVDRGETWQLGMVIPKGSWPQLRAAGLDALRDTIAGLVPWLEGRTGQLTDWSQVSLLSVTADRLPRWHRPGLLLIGDAAHVMSPVAGNGINYAIADAVAAANLLARPLAAGTLTERDLAAVQRRRQWPTRITQKVTGILQDRLLARTLRAATGPPRLVRWVLRTPLVRDLAPRLAAFGARPEHVRPAPNPGNLPP